MLKNKDEFSTSLVFNGNLYIFHAFDIGDDINLEKIEETQVLIRRPLVLPKYFKKYHIPLSIELPHPHETSTIYSCKLHSFGVISITYKIPFEETLEELRKNINEIDEKYQERSVSDAALIFKKIKAYVTKPKFFHLRTWYPVIQVDPNPSISTTAMKELYGGIIASLVRFETEMLSEYQKDEILETAMGYYRGDFIVIDSEAAFVADSEFEQIFDLFEYANIQQLELQYFDKILDKRLNNIYEHKIQPLPLTSYLPFIGVRKTTPFDLGRFKVDISVITERLENNIRLAGEIYYSEIYSLLVEKLGLSNWKESLQSKLEIIEDVQEVYQNQIESIREDLLSVLIIILIFIEMIIGLLSYFKE